MLVLLRVAGVQRWDKCGDLSSPCERRDLLRMLHLLMEKYISMILKWCKNAVDFFEIIKDLLFIGNSILI